MQFLLKSCIAFCVATILAQTIILGIAATRGNLNGNTFYKALALLNGIDITGEKLQNMLDEAEQQPALTYEEVRDARVSESKNLQMREDAVRRMKEQTEQMLTELKTKTAAFDLRKDEYYKYLDDAKKKLGDESLKDVQRTLEVLSPEQAKVQLLMMLESGQEADVVAIVKEMPLDKRKKILGEFTNGQEPDQLHEILSRIRAGEPAASLIDDARS